MPAIEEYGFLKAYLAEITATDPENRLVNVKWLGLAEGKEGVTVLAPVGNYSFPKVGDRGVVIQIGTFDIFIGKIEYNYVKQIAGDVKDALTKSVLLAKKVLDGEVFLSNLPQRAWLYISNTGGFSLMNGLGDGLRYFASNRLLRLGGMALRADTFSAITKIGAVFRNLPSQGNTVIPSDVVTIPAVEGLIDLVVNGLRLARLHIGHIKNSLGVDELGSWGARLRALIEVCNPAGTPLAVFKIDEIGNIEIASTSTAVMLNGMPVAGILLGGLAASQSAVLGEALLRWLNTHTHPTGTGPSGVPITPVTAAEILSQKVKIGA
jgi:hypothetical protein